MNEIDLNPESLDKKTKCVLHFSVYVFQQKLIKNSVFT